MAKVLIAEDDTITQKVVANLVENMGHVAFVSPDGKHAYETLMANKDFEVLITDVMMPEMDGRELVKALHEDPEHKNLPIIMISGFVGVKEISNLLEMGVSFFQKKPLNPEDLKKNINSCLER